MPRGVRSSSWAPASRSSVAIWRETAGWVKLRASAAAEKEPRRTTSRNTRRRAASNMHEVYASRAKRSFAVMAGRRDDAGAMTVLHPLLHAALSVERERDARAAR